MGKVRSWIPVLLALAAIAGILSLPDRALPNSERPQIAEHRGLIVRVIPRVGVSTPPPATTARETAGPSVTPNRGEHRTDRSPAVPDQAQVRAMLERAARSEGHSVRDPGSDTSVTSPAPSPMVADAPVGDTGGDDPPDYLVQMQDGPLAGRTIGAYLGVSSLATKVDEFQPGDEVVVSTTVQPEGPDFVAVSDRYRLPILGLLLAVFVVAVLLVGRGQGFRALIALALTIALVVKVVVPEVLAGTPPVMLALVVAGIVTVVTIGLTEGVRRPAVAAILGTMAALSITAGASWLVTEAARFSTSGAEDLLFLWTLVGQTLDVRGLLVAAFILGSLGVLDDVTVTQAATVEEIALHSGLRGRALLSSSLRVGRSHIGATVNTLFLAYVGASLPLVVLFVYTGRSADMVVNGEVVAIEVVRTLAGGLGIVAAVPITTVIATVLVRRTGPSGADTRDSMPGTERVTEYARPGDGPRPRSVIRR